MKKIILIGGGGHCKSCIDVIEQEGKYRIAGIVDMAEACLFLMNNYHDSEIINIGSGQYVTIKELAEKMAYLTGYQGKLRFGTSKPDGTPLKLLDISKIKSLGWQANIELDDGIRNTYQWYRENLAEA